MGLPGGQARRLGLRRRQQRGAVRRQENGKTIPAAGEAGKVGWFFIVNRETGKLIRKSAPFVPMSKNMFTTPTKKGVEMLPGANGGAEWSPPAFSPKTRDVYILGLNQLMTFTTSERDQRFRAPSGSAARSRT